MMPALHLYEIHLLVVVLVVLVCVFSTAVEVMPAACCFLVLFFFVGLWGCAICFLLIPGECLLEGGGRAVGRVASSWEDK